MATYTIPSGDDRVIVHTFQRNGVAFDLTGSTVRWRLFTDRDDADASALYTRTWIAGVETGLSLTDPDTGLAVAATAGILYNAMTSAVTGALTVGHEYYYELKLTDTVPKTTTIDTGTLVIAGSPNRVAPTSALVLTLADVRRRVADRFGDLTQLATTALGTTTTLIDTLNVSTAAENYTGCWLSFTSGTNNGLMRRVSSTTDSTSTLTFTPATPAVVAANTTVDVFNKRGHGFTVLEYNRAINNAINDVFPLGLIELETTITAVFDADNPSVPVPAGMAEVFMIESVDDDGFRHRVIPSRQNNEWGWIADPALGEIRILGWPASQIDGLTIRLTGYGRQPALASDSDTCALNVEFIVARAAYHLALGAIMRDTSFTNQVADFRNESERLRIRVRTIRKPGTVRVRPQ